MRSFKLADVITIVDILGAVGSFLLIFVGSTMIGVFFACFSALVYKHTNMREFPHLESGMFVMFAYASYLFAQGIGASGKVLKKNSVCSVLFCFKKVCLVFSRYRINAFLWYCHGALHLRELVSQVSADHQGINHRPLEIFEIQFFFFVVVVIVQQCSICSKLSRSSRTTLSSPTSESPSLHAKALSTIPSLFSRAW